MNIELILPENVGGQLNINLLFAVIFNSGVFLCNCAAIFEHASFLRGQKSILTQLNSFNFLCVPAGARMKESVDMTNIPVRRGCGLLFSAAGQGVVIELPGSNDV